MAQPRDVRSFIATLIPTGVICGDKVPTIDFQWEQDWLFLPWLAVANSFVMDWLVRSKLSSPKMSFTLVDSLPFPRVELLDPFTSYIGPKVLRLTCTGLEMTPFWNQMAEYGIVDPVDPREIPPDALLESESREVVRSELDALVALHIYGLTKDQLCGVLDSFPELARREQRQFGELRSKRLVLHQYDCLLADGWQPRPVTERLPRDPREGATNADSVISFGKMPSGARADSSTRLAKARSRDRPTATSMSLGEGTFDVSDDVPSAGDWVSVDGKTGLLMAVAAESGKTVFTVLLEDEETERRFVSPPVEVRRG